MFLMLVPLLGFINPSYVYNDTLVKSIQYLMLIGAVGSVLSTILRHGVKESKLLITVWSLALISIFLLSVGNDLSSLGWALLAIPSVFFGTILIIIYTFRS